jgi:hypothetical protein
MLMRPAAGSYDHFCFFDHIRESSEGRDSIAFFVFFGFKSWKRVLLSDGPRQSINALTLYAVYQSKKNNAGEWFDLTKYFRGNTIIASALTLSTLLTVLIFAGSLLLLIAAALLYIPLLCHIRGNLKEYCCHKVDKARNAGLMIVAHISNTWSFSVSRRSSSAETSSGNNVP